MDIHDPTQTDAVHKYEPPMGVRELLTNVVERIQHRYEMDLPGLETGFLDLDGLLQGLQAGDLIVMGGRPWMGADAFAFQMGTQIAMAMDTPVLFHGQASSPEVIGLLLIAQQGNIPMNRLHSGMLEDEDWPKVTQAVVRLGEAPLFFDERGPFTAQTIRERADDLEQKAHLGLLIVDHLQLMKAAQTEGYARQEVAQILIELKTLAHDLNVPVIVLSQILRTVEHRKNKRPTLRDFDDDGAVAEIADTVMALYRDEMYDPDSRDKGITEILVLKQRFGPCGTVRLAYEPRCAVFSDFTCGSQKN